MKQYFIPQHHSERNCLLNLSILLVIKTAAKREKRKSIKVSTLIEQPVYYYLKKVDMVDKGSSYRHILNPQKDAK